MTTATLFRPGPLPRASASRRPGVPRRPLLLRVMDAIMETNQRRAKGEIAAYVRRHGGAVYDHVERGSAPSPR